MMSSYGVLFEYEDIIRVLVENSNYTYSEVSSYLRQNFNLSIGCSVRNIQKFCSEHQIHRLEFRRHTRQHICETVRSAVNEVGPTYGRRMLTGLLRSRGHSIGERATASALRVTHPHYHAQRHRGTERLRNPTPYFAEYAGHKLHMDQNEKLAEYGLTHVFASDGYSGKIVGASSMPVKNNIKIYDEVYRPACLTYGLWDQVRVDYGREFYLLLYKQHCLRDMRTNTSRQPFIQSKSKQNHIAERVWVEVNQRSTYPMKRVLVRMKGRDQLNLDDEYWKGCKGIPNVRFQSKWRCSPVLSPYLPFGVDVAQEYTHQGGQITEVSPFGLDPLSNDFQAKESRDRIFLSTYYSFENIANAIANHQEQYFEQALLHYIDVTLNGSFL